MKNHGKLARDASFPQMSPLCHLDPESLTLSAQNEADNTVSYVGAVPAPGDTECVRMELLHDL
jgi:hypothetical protein